MNINFKKLGKVRPTVEGDWNKNKSYRELSIVFDEESNKSYISKKVVPSGISILNREYWYRFGNNRIDSDSILILSRKDDNNNSINSFTLEEAINSINIEDRRLGLFISFYEKPLDDNGVYRWNMYQFNSNNVGDWTDLTAWSSIYYTKNKFFGLQIDEDALYNVRKNPDIGDYAFVGETLKEAFVYRCYTKNIWKKTNEAATDYLTITLKSNITIGSNGNWFQDGEDTGIKAQGPKGDKGDNIKGDPGDTPVMRLDRTSGYVQYGYDGEHWNNLIPITDFIIQNNPDEEDITSDDNNKLKFADKSYDAAQFSGLGRKYLRKNIQQGKNILSQDMINEENTIYIIQYDYDLNNAEITIPDNSILQFDGGSLNNGTVKGNFITKYPKGNSIYKECVVEKININDFINFKNANKRYSIDDALITIINSFKNTQYRSNIDIEFSQGIFYTISKAIIMPARFNLIGVGGNAFIHTNTNFDEPTALITISKDSDNPGYINNLQYIKNITFYNEGDSNVIMILLNKGYITFENIGFQNQFYRCIKSDGYNDLITLNKVIISGINNRQSKDYPDVIHFEFYQGEGRVLNQIGDSATIFLVNGKTTINNCINLNVICFGETLTMNDCLGETGILHIYKSKAFFNGVKYVNAPLAQSYIISIDDDNVKTNYNKLLNKYIERFNASIIYCNYSTFFNQQFAFPPKDSIIYKTFNNPNNININYGLNKTKYTISGARGNHCINFKYKQDNNFNIDTSKKVIFYLSIYEFEPYKQINNIYFQRFRPDITPSSYTEIRNKEYTYTILMIIDKSRNLGYKVDAKTITGENNKFIGIHLYNLDVHENWILSIYRDDTVNKILSETILDKNQTPIQIYDNIYGVGSFDKSIYTTIPKLNECYKAYYIGNNIVAYLNNIPTQGIWINDDKVIINNITYTYNNNKWLNNNGIAYDVKTEGTFAQKPTSSQGIPTGFKYFCTDKQTTEGQANGIVIYHKGSDVWIDALGRIVE